MGFEMNDRLVLIARQNRAKIENDHVPHVSRKYEFFFAKDKDSKKGVLHLSKKAMQGDQLKHRSLDALNKTITINSHGRTGLKKGSAFCVGEVVLGKKGFRFKITVKKGIGPTALETALLKLNTEKKLKLAPLKVLNKPETNVNQVTKIKREWQAATWEEKLREILRPEARTDPKQRRPPLSPVAAMQQLIRGIDNAIEELMGLTRINPAGLIAKLEAVRDEIVAKQQKAIDDADVFRALSAQGVGLASRPGPALTKASELIQQAFDLSRWTAARTIVHDEKVNSLVTRMNAVMTSLGRKIRIFPESIPAREMGRYMNDAMGAALARCEREGIHPDSCPDPVAYIRAAVDEDAMLAFLKGYYLVGMQTSRTIQQEIEVNSARPRQATADATRLHLQSKTMGMHLRSTTKGLAADGVQVKVRSTYKSPEKLLTAAKKNYNSDPQSMTDLVQGRILYPTLKELYEGLQGIHDDARLTIIKLDDRFLQDFGDQRDDDGGYRFVRLVVEQEGFVSTLELHVKAMWDLRSNQKMEALSKTITKLEAEAVDGKMAVKASTVIDIIAQRNEMLNDAARRLFDKAVRAEELTGKQFRIDSGPDLKRTARVNARSEISISKAHIYESDRTKSDVLQWLAQQKTAGQERRKEYRGRAFPIQQTDAAFAALSKDEAFDHIMTKAAATNPIFEGIADTLASDTNGELRMGPMKTRDSARRKMDDKFGGQAEFLTDVCRCSIVYSSLSALYLGLRKIHSNPKVQIISFKDRFKEPKKDSGYRDMNLLVDIDGFTCEIQLHLKQVLEVKEVAHRIYDETRLSSNAQLDERLVELSKLSTLTGDALIEARAKVVEKLDTLKSARDLPAWLNKLLKNVHEGMQHAYDNALTAALIED